MIIKTVVIKTVDSLEKGHTGAFTLTLYADVYYTALHFFEVLNLLKPTSVFKVIYIIMCIMILRRKCMRTRTMNSKFYKVDVNSLITAECYS